MSKVVRQALEKMEALKETGAVQILVGDANLRKEDADLAVQPLQPTNEEAEWHNLTKTKHVMLCVCGILGHLPF